MAGPYEFPGHVNNAAFAAAEWLLERRVAIEFDSAVVDGYFHFTFTGCMYRAARALSPLRI